MLCLMIFNAVLSAMALSARPSYRVGAASTSQIMPASLVMQECFGERPLSHFAMLKSPWLTSNALFRPMSDLVIAVATDTDDSDEEILIGAATVRQGKLRKVLGQGAAGRTVAFVQSVAVAKEHRRLGVGRALMEWCEDVAREAWPAAEETWLAVEESSPSKDAALSLYQSLGYSMRAGGPVDGEVLLSKALGLRTGT